MCKKSRGACSAGKRREGAAKEEERYRLSRQVATNLFTVLPFLVLCGSNFRCG